MTESMAAPAIKRAQTCKLVFAKFLSPNDTGLTGGHQCGIYIPKNSVRLIFDKLFERGHNQKRFAHFLWNNEIETNCAFTYYGVGTRNEYRITRFGKGFGLLKPEHTGDLVVICKGPEESYYGFILSTDVEIEEFLDAFAISPTGLNKLIKNEIDERSVNEEDIFESYLVEFGNDFPTTAVMAVTAEEIDRALNGGNIAMSPDEKIVRWVDTEYQLFRKIEASYYAWVTLEPAKDLDEFVKTGLEITNRRKARAGKSLEHHLAAIFSEYEIDFAAQVVTEGNKKPDFIFPSKEAYDDQNFPSDKLIFLGAKTTCKDRWRQVLNEANRIPKKYLFTLQQGVSPNQLREMHAENLVLVVPKCYHSYYPKTEYESVISLEEFIRRVRKLQSK